MIPPRILKSARRTLDRYLKAPRRSAGAETVLCGPCEIRRQTEGSAQRCPAVALDIPGESDSRVENQELRLHRRAVRRETLISFESQSCRSVGINLALDALR